MIIRTLLAIVALSSLIFSGCSDPASKLPRYDVVPPFAMTDAAGRPFTQDQLTGRVSVVDFIYTNCPAECPRMSSQMHKVEKQFAGIGDVQFVSISVDPDRDTPRVLEAFAKRYGAPNEQWHFITGNPHTVHLLAFQTFHIGDVIGKIEHSTKFALVDKRRTVRGYYSSFDQEEMAALTRDANTLRREKS